MEDKYINGRYLTQKLWKEKRVPFKEVMTKLVSVECLCVTIGNLEGASWIEGGAL